MSPLAQTILTSLEQGDNLFDILGSRSKELKLAGFLWRPGNHKYANSVELDRLVEFLGVDSEEMAPYLPSGRDANIQGGWSDVPVYILDTRIASDRTA